MWGDLILALLDGKGSVYPRTAAEANAGIDEYAPGNDIGHIVSPYHAPGDVRRYGADPVAADNRAAVQAALDSNNNVWFQPGEIYMTGRLNVHSDTTVDLNNATVKLLAGVACWETIFWVCATNPDNTAWIPADASETVRSKVSIINGTIDGNVSNNPSPQIADWDRPGDHGLHGIFIGGEANRICVDNVRIIDCYTDGLIISNNRNIYTYESHPTDVTITNCDFDGNGRQGISIVFGNNIKISSCKFRNTYNSGRPSGPFAGIDIEPGYGSYVPGYPAPSSVFLIDNIYITDCDFTSNAGRGFTAIMGPNILRNLKVEGCYFSGNGHNGGDGLQIGIGALGHTASSLLGSLEDVVFTDCTIEGGFQTTGKISPQQLQFVDLTFNSCKFGQYVFGERGFGALACAPDSRLIFNDCEFRRQGSIGDSGAVSFTSMIGCRLELNDCSVTETGKTAVYFLGCTYTELYLLGTIITARDRGIDFRGGDGAIVHVGRGSIIQGASVTGIWLVGGSGYTTENKLIIDDAIIRDCKMGIEFYNNGGMPKLQSLGTVFENVGPIRTTLSGDHATAAKVITSINTPHYLITGDPVGIRLDDNSVHWTTVDGIPTATTFILLVGLPSAAASGNNIYEQKFTHGSGFNLISELSGVGDPNGRITAAKGSTYVSEKGLYCNTNGVTAWIAECH